MDDIFTDCMWKWNLPATSFDNETILIDGNREWLTFSQNPADDSMQVIYGDTPLRANVFYCWTIFIEELIDAEIMIGISTSDANSEFMEPKESKLCNLGMDENSWVISNNGYISHGTHAVIHDNWKFYQKDYITVYLNYPEKKLSFAINGNHLGVEYIELPEGCSIFPVVGVSKICSLRLKSTHESSYNLELRALLSHSYFICAQRGKTPSTIGQLSRDLKLLWLKPVPLQSKGIPAGLLSVIKVKYPWFLERNIHRTRVSFVKWMFRRNKGCTFSPPKAITLGKLSLPFDLSFERKEKKRKRRRRRERRKKCQECPLSSSGSRICNHDKCLRFFRKRKIEYSFPSEDKAPLSKRRKLDKNKIAFSTVR